MRRALTVLAAALLSAGCWHNPFAARPDALTPLRDKFASADADGDENLTRAEVDAGWPQLASAFDTIDTDGNARLSTGELRSYLEWQRVLRAPLPTPVPITR